MIIMVVINSTVTDDDNDHVFNIIISIIGYSIVVIVSLQISIALYYNYLRTV